jgi:hemerythrin
MNSPKIKTILEREAIPRVELDFMNNTHFEEIEMVKELGELVISIKTDNNQQNQIQLNQKLTAWLNHTIAHFERENELMQETGFPAIEIHISEHKIALGLMQDVIRAWKENQDLNLVESYIFSAWPAWFDQHVNTMDMMTAKFAVMNGYTNH